MKCTLDSQAPLTQWNSVVDISFPSQVPLTHFVTAASGSFTVGNLKTMSSNWNIAALQAKNSDSVKIRSVRIDTCPDREQKPEKSS